MLSIHIFPCKSQVCRFAGFHVLDALRKLIDIMCICGQKLHRIIPIDIRVRSGCKYHVDYMLPLLDMVGSVRKVMILRKIGVRNIEAIHVQ